jgi:hypothetical protein
MSELRRGLPDRHGAHRAGDLGSAAHRRWKCPNWVGAGQTAAPWEGGRASGSGRREGLALCEPFTVPPGPVTELNRPAADAAQPDTAS